jgi:hypothetical protein
LTVGQRRFLELDLREAPRQEVVVGLHVEVPVSAQVEQDDLRLAGVPRSDRLVDHRSDGVVRLRGRHNPLSPSELHARVERLVLCVCPSLHASVLQLHEQRGRVAVVPEPARMHRRRPKRAPRVYIGTMGVISPRVAEVVTLVINSKMLRTPACPRSCNGARRGNPAVLGTASRLRLRKAESQPYA